MNVQPINPTINSACKITNNKSKRTNLQLQPSFRGYLSAREIEALIYREKGISTNFRGSDFVANCVNNVILLFESLFGKSYLPSSVAFEPFNFSAAGAFFPCFDQVSFNALLPMFRGIKELTSYSKMGNGLIYDDYSSTHPAQIFVHEFGHCAHKRNIDKCGRDGAEVMAKLRKMQVPTAVGKLITLFKLGRYSLDKEGGVNEFMAERLTQDVCKDITDHYWIYTKDKKNVHYDDIFSRKWNCRYSCPQAYLDYYTQQIWKGDIGASEKAAGLIENYLIDIERKPKQAEVKQISVAGLVDYVAGKLTVQSKFFDERNRLKYYS